MPPAAAARRRRRQSEPLPQVGRQVERRRDQGDQARRDHERGNALGGASGAIQTIAAEQRDVLAESGREVGEPVAVGGRAGNRPTARVPKAWRGPGRDVSLSARRLGGGCDGRDVRVQAFAGAGQMDECAALRPGHGAAEVHDQRVREAAGVLRLGRALEDAAPGAGDAGREVGQIRAELDVPAARRRQQCDRLDEQGQQLDPRAEDQERRAAWDRPGTTRPARRPSRRRRSRPSQASAMPAGRSPARHRTSLGQDSRLALPGGLEESGLAQQPGRPALGPLARRPARCDGHTCWAAPSNPARPARSARGRSASWPPAVSRTWTKSTGLSPAEGSPGGIDGLVTH